MTDKMLSRDLLAKARYRGIKVYTAIVVVSDNVNTIHTTSTSLTEIIKQSNYPDESRQS